MSDSPIAVWPWIPTKRRGGPRLIDTPERVVRQGVRLRILTTLAGVESMTFNDLCEIAGANPGNLSHHTRRLASWGYITIEKGFVNRMTRTQYRLTSDGRRALDRHLALHAPRG